MTGTRPQPFPRRTEAPRRRWTARLEIPFDPHSWTGALIIMVLAATVLWTVEIVDTVGHYHLDRFGLKPREADGLWGVLTTPFLHADYAHVLSNTIPFVSIGWVVLLAGLRSWLIVSGIVVVGGGLLTWLVGPAHSVIVGASGAVFGWLGYLLARAYFSRRLKWIIVAVLVLVFFGTLLYGLFPTLNSRVSWQAHVCGFVAGIVAAALLHPRRGQTRTSGRTAVS